jgi:hypothetical protein
MLFVGASLLAKNANDNACFLNERGACEFFASKLAPTDGIRACPSHSSDKAALLAFGHGL